MTIIRPAVYSDLVPAAKVLAKAFQDEAMFGHYMHPYREQYPDDMYLKFLHKLRLAYISGPDHRLLVSTIKDQGDQEVVTGIAHWRRTREDPTALSRRVSANFLSCYEYLESFLYPNRAADPSRLGVLDGMGPFCAHHWTGSRADVWDLSLLGVGPDYGGKGIGRDLVKWGFEQAKQDGIGCSVVSAAGKEKFYQSCGFDVVVGRCADEGGEANPGRDIPGGTILFWDDGREVEGVKKYGEM
ncbi:hypothetical protein CLAFUW4_02683 [Fulvia fulva]|uniref:N-acetyltransferase domain-containing protein n=1 Tax=Passalora fulva TaxID=5499 RepID=A0A9Q8LBT9_PASFU|nr:uncharacterized protein CLAFUR5_02673 [Fulvia fulva]KAK4631310.1 hypothetical protein CLAFUR4_02678 [Fulvia fulva]KAK4632876.1 hypothetical protein CLAFUR0_02680 [Fulvia fulva]UJO14485.1 hypothetical protein CLAFUR5_02673 [Fulvia fulva]WPV11063.1 hypothetical protein CLAFUW4_02683 [Fulvia fulva]WPV25750.1 hypothetical protein CLAFUW7_02682 [Fulvia fulva]